MTIITLSPVGTGETQPLTDAGKIWAIIVILFGVTVVAYLFTEFSKELFRLDLYRRNKMLKSVKKLHNHYIICGYGRMGAVIARELHEKGRPFVIIDNNPEKIKKDIFSLKVMLPLKKHYMKPVLSGPAVLLSF